MAERQRFQGLCLEGKEGRKFMHFFDLMSSEQRELLRYCPYNLCVACIEQGRDPDRMVAMIRDEIPVEYRQLLPAGKNHLLKIRLRGNKKVARRG